MMTRTLILRDPAAPGASGGAAAVAAPAPAAAPAVAPAPKPAAAPSTPTPASDDPFAELDSGAKPKPKTAPEPKPGDKATPDDKTARTATAGPKELRTELERTKTALKEAATAKASLEARILDAESKGKNTEALTKQLAERDKQIEELRGQTSANQFQTSKEYKDRFEKPFSRAAEFARMRVEKMNVTQPDGTTRKATWEDFSKLYHMDGGAAELAQEMFGASAGSVLSQMENLQRLDYERSQAMEDEKASWKERQERQVADSAKEREAAQTMWVKANQAIADEHPEWFQEEVGDTADPEANALLKKGYELVDNIMQNRNTQTLQQRVFNDARLRHRAAAFTRLAYRLNKSSDKIAELEATIAEMKNSDPGDTRRKTGEAGGTPPARIFGDAGELEKELRSAGLED